MSDLFHEVMSRQESGKSKSSEKSCTSDDLSKPAPVANVKPSSSKSRDATSKKNARDKHSPKSGTQDSIDRLSDLMSSGFQNLQFYSYTSISPMKLLNCVGICIHIRYPGI